MNYTEIINELKNASLFDLYRLSIAVHNQMENPVYIKEVRKKFAEGDLIEYFNEATNSLIEAKVIQKNPKYVLVENIQDKKIWNIHYYSINISKSNTDIHAANKNELSRNHFKAGECVGFNHDGKQIIGMIRRLNNKTAGIVTLENKRWRVPYRLLFKFIDAEFARMFDLKRLGEPPIRARIR